jgi:hypothetical protein
MVTISIAKDGNPIRTVEEWFRFAPPMDPKTQWRDHRSAKELAKTWCGNGTEPCAPDALLTLLSSHPDFSGLRALELAPEDLLYFDGFSGPRNSDLAGIGTDNKGRFAITVEAKADEPFDRLVASVARIAEAKLAKGIRTDAASRLTQLVQTLLPAGASLEGIRYQLLTAVAGTLRLAQTSGCDRAVVLIHEFVTEKTRDAKHVRNCNDLDRFVGRLSSGQTSKVFEGKLTDPVEVQPSKLFTKPAALYFGKIIARLRSTDY